MSKYQSLRAAFWKAVWCSFITSNHPLKAWSDKLTAMRGEFVGVSKVIDSAATAHSDRGPSSPAR